MKKFLAILLFALIWQTVEGQKPDIALLMSNYDLHRFDIASIPFKQRFSNLNYVSISRNELHVSHEIISTNVMRLAAENIEYIGTNNGEWGGKLEIVRNGEKTEIMRGNIVHLLQVGKGLYIFEGLAHLGMRVGSVSYIADMENPGKPKLVATLPDAPELIFLDDSRPDFLRFVIVGTMSVMSLDHEYRQLRILYWDAFWSVWLNPTSIVRFKDSYFIGFPHGVAVMPAPWGPTSTHCKDRCFPVEFYADSSF